MTENSLQMNAAAWARAHAARASRLAPAVRAGALDNELIALAHQYLSDMRHPVTDPGSIKRRIEAIEKVLRQLGELS